MSAYLTLGTDSSGRPIRMSKTFAAAWAAVCDVLGFVPVITQGGFMGELAAEDSGPTHDGDAIDIRVRNLTTRQIQLVIRTLRAFGIAAWLRNEEHGGFDDPHIHAVPGAWASPSPAALAQWFELRAGGDGLKGAGSDYHPYPLADRPPEDDMSNYADQLDSIEKKQDQLLEKRAEDRTLILRIRDLVLALAKMEKARGSQNKAEHDATQAELDELLAKVEG